MSTVRARLKAAQEAIVAERFAEAAAVCEALLGESADNYNAVVFLGAAKEGLRRDEEALACYRRATAAQPDQVLGWRALAKYCESHHDRQSKQDLPGVYDRLLELTDPQDVKHAEALIKLMELLCRQRDAARAISTGKRWLSLYTKADTLARVQLKLADSMAEAPADCVADEDLFSQFEALLALPSAEVPQLQERQEQLHRRYWDLLARRCAPPERRLRAFAELAADLPSGSATRVEAADRLAFGRAELGVVRDGWRLEALAKHFAEASSTAGGCEAALAVAFEKEVIAAAADRNWPQAFAGLDSSVAAAAPIAAPLAAIVRLLCAKGTRRYADCAKAADRLSVIAKTTTASGGGSATAVAPSQELLAWCCRVRWRCLACYAEEPLLTCQEVEAMMQAARADAVVGESLVIALARLGRLEEAASAAHSLAPSPRVSAFLAFQSGQVTRARDLLLQLVQGGNCNCRPWDGLMLARCIWSLEPASAEVAALLKRCIEDDGYYSDAYYWYGRYAEEVSANNSLAEQMFTRAHQLDGDHEDSLKRLSDLLLRHGKEAACIDLLTQFAGRFHRVAPWCYLTLGVAHLNVASYHEAIDCLQRVCSMDRGNQHAWTCLGEAYRLRGSFDSAGKVFERVVKMAPDDCYVRLQLASVLHKQRLPLRAIQLLDQLIGENIDRENPNSQMWLLLAHKQLAESHLQLGADLASSGQHLSAADHLARAANNAWSAVHISNRPVCVWKLLGDALYRLGIYDSAAIECLPFSDSLRDMLLANVSVRAASIALESWQARVLYGCVDAYSSRLQQVRESAVAAEPAAAAAAATTAGDEEQGNHSSGSSSSCSCEVKLDLSQRRHHHLLESDAQLDCAKALLRVARTSCRRPPDARALRLADDHCQRAVRLAPGRADAWALLGVIRAACQEPRAKAEAQHCLVKSLSIDRGQGEVWTALGLFYYQLDDKLQLAGACFRRAIDADPTLAVAWSGCGLVARAEGNTASRAVDLWRHACELPCPPVEAVQGLAHCTCLLLTKQLGRPLSTTAPSVGSDWLYAQLTASAIESALPLLSDPADRVTLLNHQLLCLSRCGLRRAAASAAVQLMQLVLDDMSPAALPVSEGAAAVPEGRCHQLALSPDRLRVSISNSLRCLTLGGRCREVADRVADFEAAGVELSAQDLCYIGHCIATANRDYELANGYFCDAVERALRPELAGPVWATAMAAAEALGDVDSAAMAMGNALSAASNNAQVVRCVLAYACRQKPEMIEAAVAAIRQLLPSPEAADSDPQLALAEVWSACYSALPSNRIQRYSDAMATVLRLLRFDANSPAAWVAALRVSLLSYSSSCCYGNGTNSLKSLSAAAAFRLSAGCLSRQTNAPRTSCGGESWWASAKIGELAEELAELMSALPPAYGELTPPSGVLASALKRLCAGAPTCGQGLRDLVVNVLLPAA